MTMSTGHPPIPHFTNFEAVRQVDVTQSFLLTWDPFTGAGANDMQALQIMDASGDTVFMAPDLCVPRELPVGATSIEVPADTLADNQTYTVYLAFLQRFYTSTETVTDMNGVGMVSFTTEMTLSTGSGGETEAGEFIGYRLLPNGNPELTLAGTPGGTYTIQRAGSLEGDSTTWSDVEMLTVDGSGTAVFEDTEPGKSMPLFYRAVAY
ncbi:MAG: hypothetical protein KDM81_05530, partial [Verrucomicrobiae bacterium]|nr:hypothetical protein [Verrucomicrobiae bacterium]